MNDDVPLSLEQSAVVLGYRAHVVKACLTPCEDGAYRISDITPLVRAELASYAETYPEPRGYRTYVARCSVRWSERAAKGRSKRLIHRSYENVLVTFRPPSRVVIVHTDARDLLLFQEILDIKYLCHANDMTCATHVL